ncbi:alpha/beta hydrolase fold domain-containing protein [Companilactobacillus zhongbaensis]|uniref:alpha/beta hydrolase fold domain-containing protein n=1 Tax=Companilactobacillus zhongbaensis TaxID=2486009 RepID=UPI001CDD0A2B|nr:alpha/beta hydrolase fold domain-containing protein [Companilactobacillus zhongbaensis]
MIANEYVLELQRLQHIGPVDIPHIEGVNMIVKDRLDAHTYDPRFLAGLKKTNAAGLKEHHADMRTFDTGTVARAYLDDINVQPFIANEMGRKVKFFKIYRDQVKSSDNAIIYVHGGAYYNEGSTGFMTILKMLAKIYDGIIYCVNYHQCPENPYPDSILDVLAVTSLVNKRRPHLTLMGDSAGACIGLGASQMLSQLGIANFENHILFYPTVVQGSDLNGPLWDDQRIAINPNQRKFLRQDYLRHKQLDRIMTHLYLNGNDIDLTSPIISPLYADPTTFKNLKILVGEFDPLRLQAESFAEEVGTAGEKVDFVRYGGMGHSFLNYLGQCAASEDALHEAVRGINL